MSIDSTLYKFIVEWNEFLIEDLLQNLKVGIHNTVIFVLWTPTVLWIDLESIPPPPLYLYPYWLFLYTARIMHVCMIVYGCVYCVDMCTCKMCVHMYFCLWLCILCTWLMYVLCFLWILLCVLVCLCVYVCVCLFVCLWSRYGQSTQEKNIVLNLYSIEINNELSMWYVTLSFQNFNQNIKYIYCFPQMRSG